MEEWKDVVGYEGLYQVSNYGNVKSFNLYRSKEPHLLAQMTMPNGYKTVGLSKNNKSKVFLVHRLVADAFLENADCLEMVNHKDENKANNHVDNLEWCTRSYNQIYSLRLHPERKFEKNLKVKSPNTIKGMAHKNHHPVLKKDDYGNVIERYENATDAGFKMNLEIGNIFNACKANARIDRQRKRKNKAKCGGFVWEFEDSNIKCVMDGKKIVILP